MVEILKFCTELHECFSVGDILWVKCLQFFSLFSLNKLLLSLLKDGIGK